MNDEGKVAALRDRISVLTVGYHNLAAEQEFLKKNGEALASYFKAAEFSKLYLGVQNEVTRNLIEVYRMKKN